MPDGKATPQEALSRFPKTDREQCEFCGGPVRAQGRRAKKFCRALCRTRYHYRLRLARQAELHRRLREAGIAIDAAQTVAGRPSDQSTVVSAPDGGFSSRS